MNLCTQTKSFRFAKHFLNEKYLIKNIDFIWKKKFTRAFLLRACKMKVQQSYTEKYIFSFNTKTFITSEPQCE